MNAAAEQPYLPNELSRISTYESVNPDSDIAVCSVMETGSIPELIGSSSTLGPSVHIDSGSCQIGRENNKKGVNHTDEEKEAFGCIWENILSDEGDLSMFESPIDSKSLNNPSQESLQPGTNFCTCLFNGPHKSIATQAVDPCQLSETDDMSFQHEESNTNEVAENHDLFVSLSNYEPGDTDDIVDAEVQLKYIYFRHKIYILQLMFMLEKYVYVLMFTLLSIFFC